MTYALVAIGASLGGLRALSTILSMLPHDFNLPVAVAQHRDPDARDALQVVLQDTCKLPVREATDKALIEAGIVVLAPAGYHLLVEEDHFALSTEEPIRNARPSIDTLFESAADTFGPRAIGIVLTGTGSDGAAGLSAISQAGGITIVQSEGSSLAYEMPEAATRVVPDALVLAIEKIAPELIRLTRNWRGA